MLWNVLLGRSISVVPDIGINGDFTGVAILLEVGAKILILKLILCSNRHFNLDCKYSWQWILEEC